MLHEKIVWPILTWVRYFCFVFSVKPALLRRLHNDALLGAEANIWEVNCKCGEVAVVQVQ